MSSIEEKLETLMNIQSKLFELKDKMEKDKNKVEGAISGIKGRWNDEKLALFNSDTYVGKFYATLDNLKSRIDKIADFLMNKMSTLTTHRN
jgi:hypothetical protein